MPTNSQRLWPDSERTRELLAAARDGDREAVEGLMDRHRDALRKLVHHRMDRAIGRSRTRPAASAPRMYARSIAESSRRLSAMEIESATGVVSQKGPWESRTIRGNTRLR